MKLRPEVKTAMSRLDITKLRQKQAKIINSILDHHDTMVIAPTSYGKSLTYQIPAVIHEQKLTVVIEPLLSVMHDQVEKLQGHGIAAYYVDSTQTHTEHQEVYDLLSAGNVTLLYISPERLGRVLSHISGKIHRVVIDECHCVTQWGYAFRESYLSIGRWISSLLYHPTVIALSASMPPEDWDEIADLLGMKKPKVIQVSLYRSNLHLMKVITASRPEKKKELLKNMRKYHKHGTIVYCATKRAADAVCQILKEEYPHEVALYTGDNKKDMRDILSGKKRIIVATTALSMGVDLPDVDLVIHFQMPLSIAEYYQTAGRAGRNGQKARSVLLYTPEDYALGRYLLQDIKDEHAQAIAMERLDEMKAFCEDTTGCMYQSVLHALGEDSGRNCRYCTSCQRKR